MISSFFRHHQNNSLMRLADTIHDVHVAEKIFSFVKFLKYSFHMFSLNLLYHTFIHCCVINLPPVYRIWQRTRKKFHMQIFILADIVKREREMNFQFPMPCSHSWKSHKDLFVAKNTKIASRHFSSLILLSFHRCLWLHHFLHLFAMVEWIFLHVNTAHWCTTFSALAHSFDEKKTL